MPSGWSVKATESATRPTVVDLVDAARGELGYKETPVNLTVYADEAGHLNGYAWCATFEVALCHRLGIPLPPGCDSAYTPTALNGWQAAGRIATVPSVGALAYFKFPGVSGDMCDHTGIVESFDSWSVTTIDGNTVPDGESGDEWNGGAVARKVRPRSQVVGFGLPDLGASKGEEPMHYVAPCPWMAPQSDGREAYFEVEPGGDNAFVVTSYNHAPFDPPWQEGANGGADYTWQGQWCRRIANTTGPVRGPMSYPDHVAVACAGGGVYRIASG